MPRYQYACTESTCGHQFEAVQSFSDDPLSTCPVCDGRLRKVFSSVGIVFKGSGFYRTDSRQPPKDGAAKGAGDGGSGESTPEKSSSASPSSSSNPSGSGASGAGTAGAKSSGSSAVSSSRAAAS